jgi:hypothetical protein
MSAAEDSEQQRIFDRLVGAAKERRARALEAVTLSREETP